MQNLAKIRIHFPIVMEFVDPILPNNGEISPNQKPGFGIEIDDEILAKLQAGPKPDPEELRFATTTGWQWPPYL